MKRRYLTSLIFLVSTLLATPAGAESLPNTLEAAEPIQATNVRQLLTTNACRNCNLSGADLSQAHIIGADLRGADLSGANLTGANLEGADLTQANLTGANLTGAFLTNAVFASADLDEVNFSASQLYFVDVAGASMNNLDLADATVVGTPISVGGAIGGGTNDIIPIYDGEGSILEEELPILTPYDIWPPSPVNPIQVDDSPQELLNAPVPEDSNS